MNTGVGKLHQMLFYAGLEPEEYQACLPEIRKDNRKKLRAYLIIAGIFLLVIICLLGGLDLAERGLDRANGDHREHRRHEEVGRQAERFGRFAQSPQVPHGEKQDKQDDQGHPEGFDLRDGRDYGGGP